MSSVWLCFSVPSPLAVARACTRCRAPPRAEPLSAPLAPRVRCASALPLLDHVGLLLTLLCLAQAVVDSGALDSLVACLEEFDPGVKESAAWAMGYIAGHNAELAGTVVDSGAVALLVLCVQVRSLGVQRNRKTREQFEHY